MGRLDQPALRGTLLGRLLSFWNPLMLRLLRSPLHMPLSRWFCVIQWTGRKTGRHHSTPVSYLQDDDQVLITSGDRWARSLADDSPVTLWVRGREVGGLARRVIDEETAVALHQQLFRLRPLFGPLAGISRGDDREQIRRAVRAGRTMIVVRSA